MLEVDSALAAAGIDPAWLHRRPDEIPRSPLDLMRAGAMDEVLCSLTRATLQASVAQAGKSKRSPRRLALKEIDPSGKTESSLHRRQADFCARPSECTAVPRSGMVQDFGCNLN